MIPDPPPATPPPVPPTVPTPVPPTPVPYPDWERLDRRMLLIGPVRVIRQFAFPAVIALIGIGTSDARWSLGLLPALLVGALALGALPWLTTYFRRTETQLEVRRGLLHRTRVTAPLDRVRSVDLEASLLHRILGLSTVTIGTGVDDTRIELDSLSAERAEHLRVTLLQRAAATSTSGPAPSQAEEGQIVDPHAGPMPEGQDATPGSPAPAVAAAPAEELARIDWKWLRYAPFSLSRLVIVAGAVGALSQFTDELPLDRAESAWAWLLSQALALVLVGVAAAALVGWLAISMGGYVVRWWDLRLVRQDANLRLTAGLFTTRSTTIEEARIRGVELTEPVLLRLVGGAELSTLATGVGSGGTTTILPPCPLPVARGVGGAVLEDPRPMAATLRQHGHLARRRCHVRAQVPTLVAVLPIVAGAYALGIPGWLVPVAVLLLAATGVITGEASYRHLGHALTPDHLVAGSGDVSRVRTALERDGIIGWVVRQSFFQRRLGLATLVATTAAGPEQVQVVDLPLAEAVALAEAATPGLVGEFLDARFEG
ncbi:PH domain-containing protein [Nocardioides donggukensis]|uniref:PH domain-containing protein n=1 Tax=Nocardioides donggukensis TaxID=2774019 RepID=A0A927K4I8_9ACTN|nr:PH domain-containing protein [Nocardioides donggukensis]MBD8870354.1 PH domain-containing protein [Nocardioides donggukensis]